MIVSSILHFPHLPPAVTISVLEDVFTAVTIAITPCKIGQVRDVRQLVILIFNLSSLSRTLLSTVDTLNPHIGLGSLAEVISCQ